MMRRTCALTALLVGLIGFIGCGDHARDGAKSADYAANAAMPMDARETVGLHPEHNTEAYDQIVENDFLAARQNPLSTFSIDVDTASYANVRRFLNQNQSPPPGAVRIEELINYFQYDYPQPTGEHPFSVNVEVAGCPWNDGHKLARIGLKGRELPMEERPASNLVFLLDVSGSMNNPNKLPLVKSAMKLLVEQLGENDRIAIAVYASASGLVLPSTTCDQPQKILQALDGLGAGGSTNGGEGIHLAYNVAVDNFIPGGINRVILCTDGDFNVGTTNQSELVRLIEAKAKSGVFLSVLGFGQGNLKDSTMEKLADKGNGNYSYVDSIREARKVLVQQASGTLITIAKDVKIQVDFNPAQVQAYRLIGYENRLLKAEDFKDDQKDAGEIGAGHTVTALYELVPVGSESAVGSVDPSKYQETGELSEASDSDELFTVRLRYKDPEGDTSRPLNVTVTNADTPFDKASTDLQFSASVAAFGMLLRDSKYSGNATWDDVIDIASSNQGGDRNGYRREFVSLARKAKQHSQ